MQEFFEYISSLIEIANSHTREIDLLNCLLILVSIISFWFFIYILVPEKENYSVRKFKTNFLYWDWWQYFISAFGLLFFSYLVQFMFSLEYKERKHVVIISLFSLLNNLLLFMSAQKLLSRIMNFKFLINTILILLVAFIGSIFLPSNFKGIPDSFLSFICLITLGYSFSQNLPYRDKKYKGMKLLRLFVLLLFTFYGILNLLNGFSFVNEQMTSSIILISASFKLVIFSLACVIFFGPFIVVSHYARRVNASLFDGISLDGPIIYFENSKIKRILEKILRVSGARKIAIFILIPGTKMEGGNFSRTQEVDEFCSENNKVNRYPYEDESLRKLVSRCEITIEENILTCPILSRGAVIGWFKTEFKTSEIAYFYIEYIRNLSLLFETPVQLYRQNLAIERIGKSFSRWHIQQTDFEIQDGLNWLAVILQNRLSLQGISIVIENGFKKIIAGHVVEGFKETSALKQIRLNFKKKDGNEEYYEAGFLKIFYSHDFDYPWSPSLGHSTWMEGALGAIITDFTLDIFRGSFYYIERNFKLKISEHLNLLSISKEMEECFLRIGIRWVKIYKDEVPDTSYTDLNEESDIKISWSGLDNEVDGALSIVKVFLKKTQIPLWFGIERPGFGNELLIPSPWKTFLGGICSALDAHFSQIQNQDSLREAREFQATSTAALVIDTAFHQIINSVEDAKCSAELLYKAFNNGTLKVSDPELIKIIECSLEPYKFLEGFNSELRHFTNLEHVRPCHLMKVKEHCINLFEKIYASEGILLEIDITSNIVADCSLHAATTSITNLIMNARNAIKVAVPDVANRIGAAISVLINENESNITCIIKNSSFGKPIPKERQSSMFKLGTSSHGKGRGWGLYLVERTMKENTGSVHLLYSNERETAFCLIFKRPLQDQSLKFSGEELDV